MKLLGNKIPTVTFIAGDNAFTLKYTDGDGINATKRFKTNSKILTTRLVGERFFYKFVVFTKNEIHLLTVDPYDVILDTGINFIMSPVQDGDVLFRDEDLITIEIENDILFFYRGAHLVCWYKVDPFGAVIRNFHLEDRKPVDSVDVISIDNLPEDHDYYWYGKGVVAVQLVPQEIKVKRSKKARRKGKSKWKKKIVHKNEEVSAVFLPQYGDKVILITFTDGSKMII